MRMVKYITLSQFIYWAENTDPFTFDGATANPSAQWQVLTGTIKPYLDGSLDNPYSTTNPKEKLPQYFSTAAAIGDYLGDEYGDRLVAVPFRIGEFYPRINRNLNKDEAMELIMRELLSKAIGFVNLYGPQYIRKIGLADIKYNPIWNVDGTERTVYDFGQHITTDQYGNTQDTIIHGAQSKTNNYGQVQLTDSYGKHEEELEFGNTRNQTAYGATETEVEYGNTSQTTQYGAQQLTDNMAQTTDTHSETQMNDLTFKNKAQDVHSGHIDTHSTTQHSDTTTATTHTDTSSSIAHTDTVTGDTHTDSKTIKAKSDTHTTAARQDSESTLQYTDTVSGATHTDTNTSNSHQNVETKERHGNIGVTSTQELIRQEIGLLDWNPAVEFLKAFTDKILLRAYYY